MNELEKDSEIVAVRDKAASLLALAETHEITDRESQEKGVSILGDFKRAFDTVEERRKFYTVPLNDILKSINAKAKEILEPFTRAEGAVRRKLVDYQELQEAKRREAEQVRLREQTERQAEIERLAKKSEDAKRQETKEKYAAQAEQVAAKAFTPEVVVDNTVGGVSFKKRWTFEVVEPMKLPRQYLAPDEKAIRQAVRDGERNISGVRIFQETDTSVRR